MHISMCTWHWNSWWYSFVASVVLSPVSSVSHRAHDLRWAWPSWLSPTPVGLGQSLGCWDCSLAGQSGPRELDFRGFLKNFWGREFSTFCFVECGSKEFGEFQDDILQPHWAGLLKYVLLWGSIAKKMRERKPRSQARHLSCWMTHLSLVLYPIISVCDSVTIFII